MSNYKKQAEREWNEVSGSQAGRRVKEKARLMIRMMENEGLPNDKDFQTSLNILKGAARPGPKPVDEDELKRQVLNLRVKMLTIMKS